MIDAAFPEFSLPVRLLMSAASPEEQRVRGVNRESISAALLLLLAGPACVAGSQDTGAGSGTDSGADASFRNVFPEIPPDTGGLTAGPGGRPMPAILGPEQTYIPCATNRDCFKQTGTVDFGDSGEEHLMPCGSTERQSNFCLRTTVGDQRYTACMPTSSGFSVWIADYCPGRRTPPGEQPLHPQCDVCDSWAGGGACNLIFTPESNWSGNIIPFLQSYGFALRAFPEFDATPGLRHYNFARSACQGLYCRGPFDCPSGLECICIDDNATPPGLFGITGGEPLVYCNAADPGCSCRGADVESDDDGFGPTMDPPAGPGVCLWPTYEGTPP